nr:AFG1/ZapE family ATPase [Saccharopolyspora pogona]
MADKLAELGSGLRKHFYRPRGLYLFGPAGRGKSFLADAFFTEAPVRGKLRMHFHDFFDQLHRSVARHRSSSGSSAVDAAVGELLAAATSERWQCAIGWRGSTSPNSAPQRHQRGTTSHSPSSSTRG